MQRGGSAGGFDAGGNPLAQYVQSLPKAISTPAVWSDADMLNQVDELKDDVAEVRFKANLGGDCIAVRVCGVCTPVCVAPCSACPFVAHVRSWGAHGGPCSSATMLP